MLNETACHLSDLQVGDTVEFTYYGHGEHSGTDRNVTVLELRRGGILGRDNTFDGVKHFIDHEVGFESLKIISRQPGTRISFDKARQSLVDNDHLSNQVAYLLSAEELSEIYTRIYHPDFESFEWDEISGDIIIQTKPGEAFFSEISSCGDGFLARIRRPDHNTALDICIGDESEVTVDNVSVSPTELLAKLQDFLG
jgi:hypothetical protein